jgi:hypothetical protein
VLATYHGPAEWEGPEVSRFGPVRQVAVVSDVHANVAALTAVLAEIETAGVRLGDPGAKAISDLLMSPPSPAQITAESERLVFSD